jgi:murein DD-endopeptidase MepM/ murein hydrolase activator NlpD
VSRDALWEIQWHPAGGGRVRRLTLTRGGVRAALAGLGLTLVLLLGIAGVIPLGLSGLLHRFTDESARRENEALRVQGESLLEEAADAAHRTTVLAQRARRLAWTLGVPRAAWSEPIAGAPQAAAGAAALAAFLTHAGARLDALATALAGAGRGAPCPLDALPARLPVDLARAVPVAQFGWHRSPFTGREEAHYGTTLAATLGEPVRAPGAGRVLFAGSVRERRANEWNRFGTVVVIDHGGGVVSVLGHLREHAVRRGQALRRGDRVGSVGQTGWTRVPALYFEVRWPLAGGSAPVDPALVALALPLEDADARLDRPDGDLPADFALIEHLPGR